MDPLTFALGVGIFYGWAKIGDAIEAHQQRQLAPEQRPDLSDLASKKTIEFKPSRTPEPEVQQPKSIDYSHWQRVRSLPQHESVHDPDYKTDPVDYFEGGRIDRYGIQIIGTEQAVSQVIPALDRCWQDDEVRESILRSGIHTMICCQLPESHGVAFCSDSAIAINPYSQEMPYMAGTIYHEVLHLLGHDHDTIRPLQERFVKRIDRWA